MTNQKVVDKEFAAALKAYRLDRGWTQGQMANACGLSETGYRQIENAQVRPHDLTVARLKKSLPGLIQEVA